MDIEDEKRLSVAQLLFYCSRRIDAIARQGLSERAGMRIRAAHTALFPHVDRDGVRLTELAARAGVTKQAVAPLVDEMVAAGLLEKVPDPTDGRARLIRFGGGDEGLRAGLGFLRELEVGFAEQVGFERWGELHRALLALEAVLRADERAP